MQFINSEMFTMISAGSSLYNLFLENVAVQDSYLKNRGSCSRIVWKVIERGRGYRNIQSLYHWRDIFLEAPMTPNIFPRISQMYDRSSACTSLTPAQLFCTYLLLVVWSYISAKLRTVQRIPWCDTNFKVNRCTGIETVTPWPDVPFLVNLFKSTNQFIITYLLAKDKR